MLFVIAPFVSTRERNRKTREAQKAHFLATSIVGEDGVRRKIKVAKDSVVKKTVTFAPASKS